MALQVKLELDIIKGAIWHNLYINKELWNGGSKLYCCSQLVLLRLYGFYSGFVHLEHSGWRPFSSGR